MSLKHKESKTSANLAERPVLLVLIIGSLLLVFGLLRGEAHSVWLRAVQICLGCIGIG